MRYINKLCIKVFINKITPTKKAFRYWKAFSNSNKGYNNSYYYNN